MKTLKEFIDNKKLPIKIKCKTWGNGLLWVQLTHSDILYYHGFDNSGKDIQLDFNKMGDWFEEFGLCNKKLRLIYHKDLKKILFKEIKYVYSARDFKVTEYKHKKYENYDKNFYFVAYKGIVVSFFNGEDIGNEY